MFVWGTCRFFSYFINMSLCHAQGILLFHRPWQDQLVVSKDLSPLHPHYLFSSLVPPGRFHWPPFSRSMDPPLWVSDTRGPKIWQQVPGSLWPPYGARFSGNFKKYDKDYIFNFCYLGYRKKFCNFIISRQTTPQNGPNFLRSFSVSYWFKWEYFKKYFFIYYRILTTKFSFGILSSLQI